MAPIPVWSGNLRLSLVLIPVKMYPAVSAAETMSFRQIHAASGEPIKNMKGIQTAEGFEPVPDDEIVKGYEHTKGQHILIRPEEIDELKLEAKHTIDMGRFVDEADIDVRYFEKPYYLLPDGESADEGYAVMREALAKTGKVAVGQVVMGGREHLVGIRAFGKGLMLTILRYGDEVRLADPYFEKIDATADPEALALASELIKKTTGAFEPAKMADPYVTAVRELVQAKVEERAPEIQLEREGTKAPAVVNIMAALKESVQAKGRGKVQDAVRKRMGKESSKAAARSKPSQPKPIARRTAH